MSENSRVQKRVEGEKVSPYPNGVLNFLSNLREGANDGKTVRKNDSLQQELPTEKNRRVGTRVHREKETAGLVEGSKERKKRRWEKKKCSEGTAL